MAGSSPARERRALRARLDVPRSYPHRELDEARFLHLDSQLYQARLPGLSHDEVRREYLSLGERLASSGLDSHIRQSLEDRHVTIRDEITERSGLPDLDAWRDLINFAPPSRIVPDQLTLGTAASNVVNLDYYPVEISRMPVVDGRAMRPDELVDVMRTNLNTFLGDQSSSWDVGFDSGFGSPVPPAGSPEPLGAPIHIDMGLPDDGTVVVTENTPTHFRLTTVNATGDFDHPVSGHREFGVSVGPSGSVTAYVRGVDRPTGVVDSILSPVVLGIGHTWWSGVQDGLRDYVVAAGGAATLVPPTSHRVSWGLVDTFMHHGEFLAGVDADLRDRGITSPFSHVSPVIDFDSPVPGEAPITDADADAPEPGPAFVFDSSVDGPGSGTDGPQALSLDPGIDGGPTLMATGVGNDPADEGFQPPLDPSQDGGMSIADGQDAMSTDQANGADAYVDQDLP